MEKGEFRKESIVILCANLIAAALFLAVGFLYDINPEFVFYETAFLLIVTLAALLIRYGQYRRRKRKEELQPEDGEKERREYELLKEKEDFFALWAHQIKTPIAAMNLLLQNEEPDRAQCRQELFRIENYVEMALDYARFENLSGDLVLESCELLPMVKQTVKKYSTIFIHKHLKVELKDLDTKILTDEKWFCFVLEQILSNALKYTKEGGVTIRAEKNGKETRVVIGDTGIGIRSEDLPRIFEKGFTGCNGRLDKKASGLGLYLCKGVCDKLGHGIGAVSQEGKGTEVFITTAAAEERKNLTKM